MDPCAGFLYSGILIGIARHNEARRPGEGRVVMGKSFRVAAMLIIIGASRAVAQEPEPDESECMGDVMTFCSDYIPFVADIEDCLERNAGKVSAGCRKELSGPDSRTRLREEYFQ